MKTIGIIGHFNRNEEVIKALEEMGGENVNKYDGICRDMYYTIVDGIIKACPIAGEAERIVTLEEFLKEDTLTFDIPKGYEFVGIDRQKHKIIFEKIKA